MRIELVITELEPGGAERALTELAIGFVERGDTVRVTTLAPLPGPKTNTLLERLAGSEIDVKSIGLSGATNVLPAMRRLTRRLQEGNPDVVQSFLFHANVLTAWALGRRPRECRPIHVAGIRVAQPSRFRTCIEAASSKRLAGVICVSREVESFVRNHWRRGAERLPIFSIPNGLSEPKINSLATAEPFRWESIGLSPEKPVALFIGRLHPQKGLDWFLMRAPKVLNTCPDLQWVFVGEGELKPDLLKATETYGAGRMVCLPWQPDPAPLYRGADIVFLPSRYEGMPNVILEAMAAGRAILASDAEGIAELLGEDFSAQSFPKENETLMIQGLRQLLDPAVRDPLGRRNQVRIKTEFRLDHLIDRYRWTYQTLLGGPPL